MTESRFTERWIQIISGLMAVMVGWMLHALANSLEKERTNIYQLIDRVSTIEGELESDSLMERVAVVEERLDDIEAVFVEAFPGEIETIHKEELEQ